VLSSQQITQDIAYQFFIRYFVKDGETWSEIDVAIRDSSYNSVPDVVFSPDFLVLAVSYLDATGAR